MSLVDAFCEAGGRGNVVRILIRSGQLRVGQYVSAGPHHGKVRGLRTVQQDNIQSAGPGHVVEVMAFKEGMPAPNEDILVHPDQDTAEMVARAHALARLYPLQERFQTPASSSVDSPTSASSASPAGTMAATDPAESDETDSSVDADQDHESEPESAGAPPVKRTVPVILKAENASALATMVCSHVAFCLVGVVVQRSAMASH